MSYPSRDVAAEKGPSQNDGSQQHAPADVGQWHLPGRRGGTRFLQNPPDEHRDLELTKRMYASSTTRRYARTQTRSNSSLPKVAGENNEETGSSSSNNGQLIPLESNSSSMQRWHYILGRIRIVYLLPSGEPLVLGPHWPLALAMFFLHLLLGTGVCWAVFRSNFKSAAWFYYFITPLVFILPTSAFVVTVLREPGLLKRPTFSTPFSQSTSPPANLYGVISEAFGAPTATLTHQSQQCIVIESVTSKCHHRVVPQQTETAIEARLVGESGALVAATGTLTEPTATQCITEATKDIASSSSPSCASKYSRSYIKLARGRTRLQRLAQKQGGPIFHLVNSESTEGDSSMRHSHEYRQAELPRDIPEFCQHPFTFNDPQFTFSSSDSESQDSASLYDYDTIYQSLPLEPLDSSRRSDSLVCEQDQFARSTPKRSTSRRGKKQQWCRKCKVFTPKKSAHCPDCEACIQGYDHHCPWTSKCVGKQNIRYFYTWIGCAALALTYLLFVAAYLLDSSGLPTRYPHPGIYSNVRRARLRGRGPGTSWPSNANLNVSRSANATLIMSDAVVALDAT